MLELWRGNRFASPVLVASLGIYLCWLAALSFRLGVTGLPSRTISSALVHRSEWPVLYWFLLGCYAALGLGFLWLAVSECRAGRRLFR